MLNKITIAIFSILLISCSKDNNENFPETLNTDYETERSPDSLTTDLSDNSRQTNLKWIYHTESGLPPFEMLEVWCKHPGGNCLPEIVVYGIALPVYSDFIDAIDNDSVDSFFVGDRYKDLFTNVSDISNYVVGLRNGTYKFSWFEDDVSGVVYAALHRSSDVVTYKNADSKAIRVFPFR
jgi:hypothetical protein